MQGGQQSKKGLAENSRLNELTSRPRVRAFLSSIGELVADLSHQHVGEALVGRSGRSVEAFEQ